MGYSKLNQQVTLCPIKVLKNSYKALLMIMISQKDTFQSCALRSGRKLIQNYNGNSTFLLKPSSPFTRIDSLPNSTVNKH